MTFVLPFQVLCSLQQVLTQTAGTICSKETCLAFCVLPGRPSVPLKQAFFFPPREIKKKKILGFSLVIRQHQAREEHRNFLCVGKRRAFLKFDSDCKNGQEGFKCFSFRSFSKHGKLSRSHLHLLGQGVIANVNFTGHLGAANNPDFKVQAVMCKSYLQVGEGLVREVKSNRSLCMV